MPVRVNLEEILLGAFDVLGRATAKAADSVLDDAEHEIAKVGAKVRRARSTLRKRAADSATANDACVHCGMFRSIKVVTDCPAGSSRQHTWRSET